MHLRKQKRNFYSHCIISICTFQNKMCSEEKVYRAFIRNGVSEIQGALKIQDYFEALYVTTFGART